jgi:hypothetical protein
MRHARFLAAVALVVAAGTPHTALAQALQSFSGGTLFAAYQGNGDTVGWKFQTSARVVVTHLGFWDGDSATLPMVDSHAVGLWSAGGVLLTGSDVSAASPLTSGWRYEPAAIPIVLPVGTYHLGAFYPAGNTNVDGYMAATSDSTMAPGFTLLATLRDPDGAQVGLIFPTVESAIGGRYGPNLLFEAPAPAIAFTMSVTADGRLYGCGTGGSVALPPGTDVFACYEIENTGNAPLSLHDLSDSRLGPLLVSFPFTLLPGSSAFLTQDTYAPAGGTWTATWTAFNPGPFEVAADADALAVTPTAPLLTCNGRTVTFSAGIPPGITSYDGLAWPSGPGSETDFWDLAGCGEAQNWTGARGNVACASSDLAPSGAYNTQLRTPAMNLSGQSSAAIGFTMNYQDGAEVLELESSINYGASWQPVTSLGGPVGPFRGVGGGRIVVSLDPLAGQAAVRLRWRYQNANPAASDAYVQIDNIALTCGDGIFFDGFESADNHAWSSASG